MSESKQAPLAVTTKEAARLCSISERHFLNLDENGRLGPRAIRLGNCVRWSVAEIRDWMNAGCPERSRWDAMRQTVSSLASGRDDS